MTDDEIELYRRGIVFKFKIGDLVRRTETHFFDPERVPLLIIGYDDGSPPAGSPTGSILGTAPFYIVLSKDKISDRTASLMEEDFEVISWT